MKILKQRNGCGFLFDLNILIKDNLIMKEIMILDITFK